MKIRTRNIIIIAIVICAGLYFTGYILGHKSRDRASSAVINDLQGTLSTYSLVLNKTKVTVSQQTQIILTQREVIKKDSLTREELRKLNIKQASEITRLKLRVDTLLENVNHNGQIIHLDTVFLDKRSGNAILLPFSFEKKDKWLTLNGDFDGSGKLNIKYILQLGVDLYVGIDKTTKKPTASLLSDNPYLKVLSINSIKMDTPKDKRYGIGIQGGYGVMFGNPIRSGFYLGFGASYNLIKF